MFLDIVIVVLMVAALVSGVRILVGPSMWDRLLGVSLVCSKLILVIVIFSLTEGSTFYLDIALVVAMLGFVGTTSLSTFLRKGK